MGCLKRFLAGMGCLVVLAAAALGVWLARDRIAALYRRVRGLPEPPPVVYAMPDSGGASRATARLEALTRRGGPAYVDLTAADLAALIERQLAAAPHRPLDSVGVALGEQRIRVRGSLDMSVLPHRLLGPLAQGLGRREPVVVGGALSVPAGGHLAWTIDELKVRDFPFPKAVIPSIVAALGVPGARGAAVPLELPAGIGDLRVSPDRVRAYRASAR